MLNIQRFEVNPLQTNCYIVFDETSEAVVIDNGSFMSNAQQLIESFINDNKLKLVHLLCTHGHFDHTFAASQMMETFGVEPEINKADVELYKHLESQVSMFMGQIIPCKTTNVIDSTINNDDDIISFGTHQFKVITTPGHTPGGVCFYCQEEGVLFSGDSLFKGSIGRCDFPGGNEDSLISSLKSKVLTLPGNVRVMTGHGPETTVANEQTSNLYLRMY